MLSVLSVDSKRKSGSRQHPSCFETHGRRFENKRNRCCTKEFCSRIFYQHLFVALCIRFVETDYGRYNFPIYPTRLEEDETKGNVTSLEVRFTLAGGQEEKSMIAFNESGKILLSIISTGCSVIAVTGNHRWQPFCLFG